MCREVHPHRPSGLIGPQRIAKLEIKEESEKETKKKNSEGLEAYDWGRIPYPNQSASTASENVGLY